MNKNFKNKLKIKVLSLEIMFWATKFGRIANTLKSYKITG